MMEQAWLMLNALSIHIHNEIFARTTEIDHIIHYLQGSYQQFSTLGAAQHLGAAHRIDFLFYLDSCRQNLRESWFLSYSNTFSQVAWIVWVGVIMKR